MQTNARTRHTDTDTRSESTIRSRSGWTTRGVVLAPPAKARSIERRVQMGECPVCTCDEVHFDEVEFGARMKLAECPRCEHRWTTPAAARRLGQRRRRLTVVQAASVDRAAQA